MHELALAEAVVSIAERHAQGRRVASVELAVGRLRQVVVDALAFSFELVAQGTPVEGAELQVEEIPIVIACDACNTETQVETFPLACARCGAFEVQVRSGEEFHVVGLELEEAGVRGGEEVAVAAPSRRRRPRARRQLLKETTKGGMR
jgi:hydrogenase nickel incorporation protein HypA/HybF